MKLLALSPHTDDVELSAGGTIARYVEEGAEVYCVAFSEGSASVVEFSDAMKALGVEDHIVFNMPTRHFPANRQEILDVLIGIREKFKPTHILCPSSTDVHQDHGAVRAEALRAFKRLTVWGYQEPWNQVVVDSTLLVRLTVDQMHKKIRACDCYVSQDGREYTDPEHLWALAAVRGVQAGTSYAEGFEVIRWVE